MRLLPIICAVLLGLVSATATANLPPAQLLTKADSLMNHFRFDEAQAITDSLLEDEAFA